MNAALRALIVDDEAPARALIARLLQSCDGIHVIGSAGNGDEALSMIHELRPDLVFLDIQMPGRTGLEVMREIGIANMPVTIFVTAYDQYAIKAFELAAVDYLLKPFDDERFEQAVARARNQHEQKQAGKLAQQLQNLLNLSVNQPLPLAAATRRLERIAVESRGQVRVVHVDEIDYISASGVYAELHVGDKAHIVRERMQTLEERLDPQKFFRVHRSIIVRLSRIDILFRQAGGDYTLRLKNGSQVPVSRARVEKLEEWMGVLPTAPHIP